MRATHIPQHSGSNILCDFLDEIARGLVLHDVASYVKDADVVEGVLEAIGMAGSGEVSMDIDIDKEMLAECLLSLVDAVTRVETEAA